MQIFVLEKTPHAAARALCDRHVVNQIGETAELLAIAHCRNNEPIPPLKRLRPRVRQRNHPCAVWVATNSATYRWTFKYAVALCIEYTERFGREHAYEPDIVNLLSAPPFSIPMGTMPPWPQVMPEELRIPHDPVTAYRSYYQEKALRMRMRWTTRGMPTWYAPAHRVFHQARVM